jgi:hypothetical protein
VALLEDGVAGALSPNQREIAGILNQNTVALQSQIEALLRYNAAAFDAQHVQRQRVDINNLLAHAIDSQRLQWQAARLTVVAEGRARPITADADKLATVHRQPAVQRHALQSCRRPGQLPPRRARRQAAARLRDQGRAWRPKTRRASSNRFTRDSASRPARGAATASACPSCRIRGRAWRRPETAAVRGAPTSIELPYES